MGGAACAGCVASTTTVTTTGVGEAGMAVGGSAVGEGTTVGGCVAYTTTVCMITTGVGEASTTVGAGGSVGAAAGALLQAVKITTSKRIINFFMVSLLVEWIKKFYSIVFDLSRQRCITGLKA